MYTHMHIYALFVILLHDFSLSIQNKNRRIYVYLCVYSVYSILFHVHTKCLFNVHFECVHMCIDAYMHKCACLYMYVHQYLS